MKTNKKDLKQTALTPEQEKELENYTEQWQKLIKNLRNPYESVSETYERLNKLPDDGNLFKSGLEMILGEKISEEEARELDFLLSGVDPDYDGSDEGYKVRPFKPGYDDNDIDDNDIDEDDLDEDDNYDDDEENNDDLNFREQITHYAKNMNYKLNKGLLEYVLYGDLPEEERVIPWPRWGDDLPDGNAFEKDE